MLNKMPVIRIVVVVVLAICCVGAKPSSAAAPLVIELDAAETPELRGWGEHVQKLSIEWYPRICNLLPSEGFTAPSNVQLKIARSNQGIAGTSGAKIEVSSHWIEKHPDDVGLVIHELVHVVQAYPSGEPMWITEGIADYVRWAIFEGKPQSWFPAGREKHGYKAGYQVTAGFLLWLEADRLPGVVNKLNSAMRKRAYSDDFFKAETGLTLDDLWQEYASGPPD